MHAPSPLQGSVEVREVRILFVGKGRAGKTSLFKALLSGKGLTELIHEDDRTVGIDVVRGWRPGGEGSDLQVHLSLEQIRSRVVTQESWKTRIAELLRSLRPVPMGQTRKWHIAGAFQA